MCSTSCSTLGSEKRLRELRLPALFYCKRPDGKKQSVTQSSSVAKLAECSLYVAAGFPRVQFQLSKARRGLFYWEFKAVLLCNSEGTVLSALLRH